MIRFPPYPIRQGGGFILFGIDEKSDYAIVGVYDAQGLQTKVTEQALQMQPVVRPVFTVAKIDGCTVVSAEIAECDMADKSCFYRGAGRLRGSYIRVGETENRFSGIPAIRNEMAKAGRPRRFSRTDAAPSS